MPHYAVVLIQIIIERVGFSRNEIFVPMSLLQARLLSSAQEEQTSEQAEKRKLQVGSGDRSERIRTYNFPQNRLTDHRINLTLYKLDEVIQGDMSQVIDPLRQEFQAEQLTSLASGEL